jgi:hypothetical protein
VRAGHLAGWTALAAGVLAAAGALLPVPPQLLASGIDAAFGATLHFGAAHGYAVGTRLISTFGPLGFVFYDSYNPATFAWLLGLRTLLAALTAWVLAWLGYAAWESPWGAAVALLVCAPFLAPPDVWFLTLPLLAVLIELPSGRPAPASLRAALGAALGLVSLVKFTVLLAAVAVLVPLTLSALLARRVPLVALAALLTGAVGWVATGHGAVDGLRYLDWSLREISAGYASSMQVPTDPLLLLHAVAVSLAVFAAAALLVRRRLRAGRWAADVALAGALYLLFKAGFVRADVHVFVTVFGLVVIALLLALLWSRRPAELAVAALLVALLPGGLWAHAVRVQGPPIMYFPPVFLPQAIGRLTALPLVLGGDILAQAQARRAADIRAAAPLPALRGAVDVYSYDQTVPLAYGLDLRPRPVFQSYMAYSPRLARANADHLLGDEAPEWILFRVAPIDQRLPALDDAPSWPLLMTRYRLAEPAGSYALLQRRATPLPWRLESLGRVETETGSIVEVPPAADGPIWARIDVRATTRDALIGALLSAPVVYVSIALNDDGVLAYRLVPALAREGFLLSPVVANTEDFKRLIAGASEGVHVHSAVRLGVQLADTPGIDPAPRAVSVEFFRLHIGS